MDSFQNIIVTVDSEKGVALVHFNRRAKRNAFSQLMIDEIVSALRQLDDSDAVRAVVLTGGSEGPFCGKSPSSRLSPLTIPNEWHVFMNHP